jgi:hypothetical protein
MCAQRFGSWSKRKMRKTHNAGVVILYFALICVAGCSSQRQAATSKQGNIAKIVSMTSASALKVTSDLAVKDVTEVLKQADPNTSPQSLTVAADETVAVVQEHRKEIEDRIHALYDTLFSEEEIQDLLRSYEKPTGQNMIQPPPRFEAESVAEGKAMRKTLYPIITQRVMARLKREGLW